VFPVRVDVESDNLAKIIKPVDRGRADRSVKLDISRQLSIRSEAVTASVNLIVARCGMHFLSGRY
jgi:hypothetical protein